MENQPTTGPDIGRDTSRYTLSVEEASDLFAQAGVPRSPRSVQRYCKHGVLEAIAIDTDANEKYLIEAGSVERRITELKQVLQSFGERKPFDTTRRDIPGHDAPSRDESRRDATSRDNDASGIPGNEEATVLKEMISKLKSENEELALTAE